MLPLPSACIATAHNELIGSLIAARLITQSRLTPGSLRLATDWRTPLTTTMRMVARIHNRASDRGATPHVTRAPGLSDTQVLVVYIAHLSNRCHAENMHPALLT